MKISDFKELDKLGYTESIESIIKNGHCGGVFCMLCPLSIENQNDPNYTCDINKRVERSEAFKKMVEEEKNRLEEEKVEKFKVGDRVRVVKARKEHLVGLEGEVFEIGSIGLIVQIDEENLVCFKFDDVEKVNELKATVNGQDVSMGTGKLELPKKIKIIKCKNNNWWYDNKIGEVYEVIGEQENDLKIEINGNLTGFVLKTNCEIVEDKQEEKQEPFELKEGMKFKVIGDTEIYTVFKKIYELIGETYWVNEFENYANDFIDWEETRKLNEVKEEAKTSIKASIEIDVDGVIEGLAKILDELDKPKQELYVIWNPKGKNPHYKHTSLKDAEKEAERLAKANPNQEFYVLKALKKAKGQVKIEWE